MSTAGRPRRRLPEGHRSGRLTVLGDAPGKERGRYKRFARCDCGAVIVRPESHLKHGNVQSCGCLYRETRRLVSRTHGMSRSPEHEVWQGMKTRCVPGTSHSENYGDRGITVCTRWAESFEAFLVDMGPRPGPGYSIDRINNDGNYEPDNCHWATRVQQNNNRRPRRWGRRP